jgi:hypothetical protein
MTLIDTFAEALGRVGHEIAGDVEVVDSTIRTARGVLHLRPELVAPNPGDSPRIAHVHVAMVFGRGPYARMDTCVVGLGDSEEERLADATGVWRWFAAPPLLTLATRRWVGGAEHFDGQAQAAPGLHGYVGPVLLRAGYGSDRSALDRAPFFAGAEGVLPEDDDPHAVKSLLTFQDGAWTRVVEVDGHGRARRDERVDWPAPPAPFAAATRYAILFRPL